MIVFLFWFSLCDPCNGLATVAHRLCVDDVDSAELMALVVCRLIALDKNHVGVQPIGVGDIPWRIIAKAILHVIGSDIHAVISWALQTYAGHDAGSEAAIHAMRAIFEDKNIHVALLVNATKLINAFNLFNRQATLHILTGVEEGSQFRGGLISQQEKFSVAKN